MFRGNKRNGTTTQKVYHSFKSENTRSSTPRVLRQSTKPWEAPPINKYNTKPQKRAPADRKKYGRFFFRNFVSGDTTNWSKGPASQAEKDSNMPSPGVRQLIIKRCYCLRLCWSRALNCRFGLYRCFQLIFRVYSISCSM